MPLNPLLSYTPWKWRQPEDTISEDSDPISPGEDVIFTFVNLPDPGSSNPFTPKGKKWGPLVLQGDGGDSGDGDPPDDGNPNSGDFNNDDDDNDEVDNHLDDINE